MSKLLKNDIHVVGIPYKIIQNKNFIVVKKIFWLNKLKKHKKISSLKCFKWYDVIFIRQIAKTKQFMSC